MKTLKTIFLPPESSCNCKTCQEMCHSFRPCRGTPEEIQKIIKAGFEERLMLDFWQEGRSKTIYFLTPASPGYTGRISPFLSKGCVFFHNGCDLHKLGLKPLEGRIANCGNTHYIAQDFAEAQARSWNTKLGKRLVKEWIEKHEEDKE